MTTKIEEALRQQLIDISPYILWYLTHVNEDEVGIQASLIVLFVHKGGTNSKPITCSIQLSDLSEKYPQGWWEGPALETVAMTICKACAVELVSMLIVDKEPTF